MVLPLRKTKCGLPRKAFWLRVAASSSKTVSLKGQLRIGKSISLCRIAITKSLACQNFRTSSSIWKRSISAFWAKLLSASLGSPFLLRTAEPPLATVHGQKVVTLRRLGKRICFGFESDLWLVLHLMIAGRLHWKDKPGKAIKQGAATKLPNKRNLATFEFGNGTLSLTEAGTQRRASLHLLKGADSLERLNPGGLEVLESDLPQFAA